MENLWRRVPARRVACADLILTCISVTPVILQACGFDMSSTKMPNPDEVPVSLAPSSPGGGGRLLIFSVFGIITAVQFWAIYNLWRATNLKTEPHMALKMSGVWFIITCVFVALSSVRNMLTGSYIILVLGLAVHGWFLLIVYKYRIELRAFVEQKPGLPEPTPIP